MKSTRTTLTLDPDVAAALGRLQRSGNTSFKAIVNQLLRLGLEQLARGGPGTGAPFRTASIDLGESLIPLDDVAEVVAIAEGESFR